MKKLLSAAAVALALATTACNNHKAEEQKQMKEVMDMHDKVMGYDEHAMKNKILLDSLSNDDRYTAAKDSMILLSNNLETADKAMSIWMEKFNPDFSGKSHAEITAYLADQRKQIGKIDALFSAAISQSGAFLQKHGLK